MNAFTQLQEDVAARLQADPYLADVPLITEKAGDIVSAVDRALSQGGVSPNGAGKCGVAMVIITPSAKKTGGQGHKLIQADVVVRVTVYEQPPVNMSDAGIGKPALDIISSVMGLLQGWRTSPAALPGQWSDFDSISDDQGGVSYYADFIFTRTLNLAPTP